MSKKSNTYFSQYQSPNIVIVPTLSQCKSSPSKKARLEDTPNIKTKEIISCSKINTNPTHDKQAEQPKYSKNVKMHKNLSTEIMLLTEKNTNLPPEIIKKQVKESNIKNEKMEKEISKETISSSGTDPDSKIVTKLQEQYRCNYDTQNEENITKNNIIPSEKNTNGPGLIKVPIAEPKNYYVKIDKNIKEATMLSCEKNINQTPEIITKQTDEIKDKKKGNTSWASNYMQSIGQIHKKTTRITLKTHKSQNIDDVSIKTNDGVKEIKQTLPNEAFKDKNKPTSSAPQKPRKCKKIKLEITVVFQEPKLSSSDTDSNDGNGEDEPYVNADMSFLEDINVDEIVKSLCENISTKKEEEPCKANDNFEENNNIQSNEVSKKNRTDLMEETLIPCEKIKIEQKSPVSNSNKKESLQSKENIIKNKLHAVKNKTNDQFQTSNPSKKVSKDGPFNPCLEIRPDDAKKVLLSPMIVMTPEDAIKENSSVPISSIKLEEGKVKPITSCPIVKKEKDNVKLLSPSLVSKQDAKQKPLAPILIVNSEDAKDKRQTPDLSVISGDAKKRPLTPSLVIKAACAKEKPITPSVVIESVDVKAKPLAPTTVLQPIDAKENCSTPISPVKSEDAKVYILTPYMINKKDEDKENPQTTSLEAKADAKDKSLSSNRAFKPNDAKDLSEEEKSITPNQPKTSCLVKPSENNKDKSVSSSQVTKPNATNASATKSSRLDMKPEDAKEKPLIPSLPQTTSLTIHSDKAKSKPLIPSSVLSMDKVLATNLESRLFLYLNEKFTVISNIHKGKYSRIYHLLDSKKRNYAVKMLNNESDRFILGVNKENMLVKLQREIPKDNLQFIYVHNGFSLKGYWCFLMDFYPKNLHQALHETDKPFHIDKVQQLARQLVTAVTILRNNNIVHSDIKPGHILLNCANDKLKVCGFDGSYFINSVNLLPNIGTVNYRAPEIIIGHSAGYSIDVWATALVMYEMATNTKLFPGSYNNDILYKQICTLGTIPYNMVQKSLFRDNHFRQGKFMRRVGFNGKKTIILDQFYKNDKLQKGIFKAYQYHWCKNRSREQQKEDLEKLGLLHLLLEQMLVLNLNCRLGIEFVYANPFIYEFC